MMQFNKYFIAERDAVMLSLDKERITAFCEQHGLWVPDNDISFWGGVYKSVLAIKSATEEQKTFAREWLIAHNMQPYSIFEK